MRERGKAGERGGTGSRHGYRVFTELKTLGPHLERQREKMRERKNGDSCKRETERREGQRRKEEGRGGKGICSSRSSRDAAVASRGRAIQVEKAKVSSHDACIRETEEALALRLGPRRGGPRFTRTAAAGVGPWSLNSSRLERGENGTFLLARPAQRLAPSSCRDSARLRGHLAEFREWQRQRQPHRDSSRRREKDPSARPMEIYVREKFAKYGCERIIILYPCRKHTW